MQFEGINSGKFRQGKYFLDIFSKIQNEILLGIFRRDKFRYIQIYLDIFRCNLRILMLSIGHTQLPGFQRVLSFPFSFKRYRKTNRQDLVFVRPPDAGKDFRVSINTVWYCRDLLLFSFHTSTDSGIKRHDCAFVSLLWEYDAAPPGTK